MRKRDDDLSAPKLPPRSSPGAAPQRAQSSPQQNPKKGSGRSGSNSLRASPLPLVLEIASVGFGLILLAKAVGEDNGDTLELESVIGY